MRCVYCDEEISKISLTSLFLQEDKLCSKCRSQLPIKRRIITKNDMKVETFYEYDGMFKSLLLQFKECYDEALKDVFLYKIADYINVRYYDYHLVLVPSSKKKENERGFNHLEMMFERVKLKRVNGLRMKQELVQEEKNYLQRSMMIDNYIYDGDDISRVLIVDDVMTTGSSLYGVYSAFKKKVRKAEVLSLAYKSKYLHN